MTQAPPLRVRLGSILAIALLSAALLAFQVLLTRVCALRLHFHFGFLIISNSLLGIGASGSLLSLLEARWRKDPLAWTWGFAAAFVLALPLAWLYLLTAQIPETLNFSTAEQTAQFALFNLACAVPFFFGGTAVGLILASHAAQIGKVYAADLIGAGLGCLLCPLLLWPVGAGGCFAVTVVLGIAGALCTAPPSLGMAARCSLAALAVFLSMWVPRLDRELPVPGKRYLDITAEHTLREFGRPLVSQWSANSRVDVLPMPAHLPKFMSARGTKAMAMPLPSQMWIMQDGDAGTMLQNFSGEPERLEVLDHTLYAATFRLKKAQKPKVFIIGVGGASDLWAAWRNDASLVRGVELNQAIRDLHFGAAEKFSSRLVTDPRVQIVVDEGRSALMRQQEQFDVIQMTGIDTWTALNSGAYVLAENYLYTVEACRGMYERLAPGGILQISRMAAGMETIRLLHNLYTALPEPDRAHFADSVAALRTPDYLIAVLLKKGTFAAGEVDQLAAFAADNGIDRIVPGNRAVLEQMQKDHAAELARIAGSKDPAERQRAEPALVSQQVGAFVLADDKAKFADDYEFDVSPTTDDRPYFFSFLRWGNHKQSTDWLEKPTWIVQGNPVFLQNQLLYSSLAAALFILLPLLFRRGAENRSRAGAVPLLVYFAGLGFGFIAIEVSLIQKFTLLLGQPLYSIVVTLFAILVATGFGSLLSERLLRSGKVWWIPAGVTVLLFLIAWLSPTLVQACIGLPLPARGAVVAVVIAPLAMLLGMPFAHGVTVVNRVNPSLVPWAWAVNGSTTVIGSIATVILSMNFGFAAVLGIAAVVYLVAFAMLSRVRA